MVGLMKILVYFQRACTLQYNTAVSDVALHFIVKAMIAPLSPIIFTLSQDPVSATEALSAQMIS